MFRILSCVVVVVLALGGTRPAAASVPPTAHDAGGMTAATQAVLVPLENSLLTADAPPPRRPLVAIFLDKAIDNAGAVVGGAAGGVIGFAVGGPPGAVAGAFVGAATAQSLWEYLKQKPAPMLKPKK